MASSRLPVKPCQRTSMPTFRNTLTMPVSWQIGRWPVALILLLVRICAIASLAAGLCSRSATELDFHGHHNLAMGVANSIAAVEAGANRIDAAAGGLASWAGNTPLEVFVAVCDRMGIQTGVDVFKIQDVAEDRVAPIMDHMIRVDRDSLTLGYAGVYSRFLLFAQRAEKKYGVPPREILVELGRKGAWSARRKT